MLRFKFKNIHILIFAYCIIYLVSNIYILNFFNSGYFCLFLFVSSLVIKRRNLKLFCSLITGFCILIFEYNNSINLIKDPDIFEMFISVIIVLVLLFFCFLSFGKYYYDNKVFSNLARSTYSFYLVHAGIGYIFISKFELNSFFERFFLVILIFTICYIYTKINETLVLKSLKGL